MSKENRQDPRVSVNLDVHLQTAAGEEKYETKDVSYRGVFIVCDEPFPLRKLVRFRATLDDGEQLQMLGLVAHHVNIMDAAERSTQPGMGLQLYSLGARTHERWREFVRFKYDQDPEAREAVEKRELPHLRIHLADDDMKRRFIGHDFPSGGIFYRTPDIHPEGTDVVCDVVHPETGRIIELNATVTEVVEGPRRSRGMQIVFEELSEASEHRLHRFDRGEHSEVMEDHHVMDDEAGPAAGTATTED